MRVRLLLLHVSLRLQLVRRLIGVHMKWFLLTAIVLSHNILPGKESTPSLRALVACDLISTNIQKGSQADLDRIKKSISNIAHQLNIHRRITVLDRKKFKVNNVSRWLSSIKPNSKDIVLFYFSGHGGRLRSSQGPWPFLVFPESADHWPRHR